MAVARTEIIRTHAEGQLDAFERLGVTEVGVMAEWITADDERVCPLCKSLDGVVLKVKEARGLLPRHTNCRCAWTPANVGEDESKQKRSKSAIQKAIDASYGAESSKRTIAEQKLLSSWGGADKLISKKRPESVFNQLSILNRSFFADCKRNKKGHCLPGTEGQQLKNTRRLVLSKAQKVKRTTAEAVKLANKKLMKWVQIVMSLTFVATVRIENVAA